MTPLEGSYYMSREIVITDDKQTAAVDWQPMNRKFMNKNQIHVPVCRFRTPIKKNALARVVMVIGITGMHLNISRVTN